MWPRVTALAKRHNRRYALPLWANWPGKDFTYIFILLISDLNSSLAHIIENLVTVTLHQCVHNVAAVPRCHIVRDKCV